MGKPKLCRMKRLDVSPPKKFFFLLNMNHLILSPSHSTFLLTEKALYKSDVSAFERR